MLRITSNLIFISFCILFIKSVRNNSLHSHFHFNWPQTNCSSDDLKCLNKIQTQDLTLRDNVNSSATNRREECVQQTYFDLNRNQCIKCSVECPKNSRIERNCNQTHDIHCVCNTGFFMTIDSGCKPCSECESGWGIWRSCRGSRNTVCRKCPPGTFSGVKTGTLGCILCTKCNSNEVMVDECSGVHDSICVDKRKLENSLTETKADNFSEGGANRLPIYFGLLVIIVLVLIFYVIIQMRIKRIVKSGTNMKFQQKFKHPVAYDSLYNPSVYTHRQYDCNQIVKNYKLLNNYTVYNEKQNCSIGLIVKRYNELNTSVRRAFEIKLNNESQSWKSLAKQLGYTSASISTFESLGRQHINCVQYFLTDWSKYEDSTINCLLKALLKIGRIDCVLIIDPSFRFSPY